MRQASTVKRTTVKSRTPKNRIETPLAQTSYVQMKIFIKRSQEKAYELYVARGAPMAMTSRIGCQAEKIVKGS